MNAVFEEQICLLKKCLVYNCFFFVSHLAACFLSRGQPVYSLGSQTKTQLHHRTTTDVQMPAENEARDKVSARVKPQPEV
jgi:hypothetical protein